MRKDSLGAVGLVFFLFLCFGYSSAAENVTTPKEQFGFNIGDDYVLVNYTQLQAYWQKLDRESERVSLQKIGTTAEGRPMIMAVVTSPANQKKLGRYREISRRLALAEGIGEAQARSLAAAGKVVVQIDGGLHATEILGSQQLIELVYQLAGGDDAETRRLLDNVILLAIPSNPDGLELVADWYMKEQEPAKRTMRGLPRLYQKYIGHDNNRDFYMVTQPETEAVSRVMYREWYPQIIYNHHQTGPAGTVLFCSPFRDPFNYYFDPLVPMGVDLVGAAMHSRFVAEGKPGATMRSGASYSTWWSGGLRSTGYFHNMIGILTETIGNPTPQDIPFLPDKQLPRGDLPFPVAPQKWHFRQSIDYSITADRAILDLAARLRETFLFNAYKMGKNNIDRGNRDHWTVSPRRVAGVEAAIRRDEAKPEGRGRGYPVKYYDLFRVPEARDPRGFILPADQPDFLTATKFVNALIKSGVAVLRAGAPFQVGGKAYPRGSYVVRCNQAFRPHILAMFEPQDHPHDVPYPGGPPNAPYDNAGWTLAYQMGVSFDRCLESFDGPFEKIEGMAGIPVGAVEDAPDLAGYFLDHRVNDAAVAVNRVLKSGGDAYWLLEAHPGGEETYPPGTIYFPARSAAFSDLKAMAESLGLRFEGTRAAPAVKMIKVKSARLGLWDQYGGSMASGWARWLLEQFEFPFEVVFPPDLEVENLRAKFDILVFVGGAIPQEDRRPPEEFRFFAPPKPEEVPEEYRSRLGSVSVAKTVPFLRRFLEDGGWIVAIGGSTSLGHHLGLPLSNPLVERSPEGAEKPLAREKYYVPGSILQARVDTADPFAFGTSEKTDFYFSNSPVFSLNPDAAWRGVRPLAWFESEAPLRSGWAWGQHYLNQTVALAEAQVGRGKLLLCGPDILFRGQPHGTFKFLFNALHLAAAEESAAR